VPDITIGGSLTNLPDPVIDSTINQLNRREFVIREAANVSPTSSPIVQWTEEVAVVEAGAAGMTDEGEQKKKVSYSWRAVTDNVKKITARTKMSEEMIQDFSVVLAEIRSLLTYEINLVEETQMLTGDGNGLNLNGVTKYAVTLSLASIEEFKETPNYYDVLGAAITQINVNTLGRGNANRIYVNPADYFVMVHGTVATDNQYIKSPVAVMTAAGLTVNGVLVVPTLTIPASRFLVADMTKYNIRDRVALSIRLGQSGTDFEENMYTLIAEKRLGTYVKANDVQNFVYDTWAGAISFLTAPVS
jgi:HK97 family phage major capsid protein